ncbi:MAG: hypothetical protein A2W23_09305 [Planctomycetes bacterium RBG_16_43_13]|nr:MAG: hypothetical protein A2W23_09305 [Planctomycetes bacterium RBG_16_43_13]
MFRNQIGETAGKLWSTLGKEGVVPFNNLSKLCDCGDEKLAHLALGWLAREDKVKFQKNGKAVLVSLTEKEVDAYKKNCKGNTCNK